MIKLVLLLLCSIERHSYLHIIDICACQLCYVYDAYSLYKAADRFFVPTFCIVPSMREFNLATSKLYIVKVQVDFYCRRQRTKNGANESKVCCETRS